MGQEPDPDKMPLDSSDFPYEVQVAFFISNYLEDIWDGMSGSYLGKRYGSVEYLFKIYNVEQPEIVLYFIKLYENILVSYRADKAEQKRKQAERKASGSGKNFTHNVKG